MILGIVKFLAQRNQRPGPLQNRRPVQVEKGDNLQRCPGKNAAWISGKSVRLVNFVFLARSQRYAVSKKLTWDPKKGSRNGSPNKTHGFSGANFGKSVSFRVGKTPQISVWSYPTGLGARSQKYKPFEISEFVPDFPRIFFPNLCRFSFAHIRNKFWCNRCTGNKFSFCFPRWCFQAFFYFHPEPWGFMIQFDELIFSKGLVQPPTSSLRGTRQWHGPSVGPSKEDSKPQESLWVAIPAAFLGSGSEFFMRCLP